MARSSRSAWESQQRKNQLEYIFRSYVRPRDDAWSTRYGLLRRLAETCGDHASWSDWVHVQGDRQDWLIWGFKDYELKLKFDAGSAEIMARTIEVIQHDVGVLPIGKDLAQT